MPFVGLMSPRLNLEKLSGNVVEKNRTTCSCGFIDELLHSELDCGSKPLMNKEDEDEEVVCFWLLLVIRADEDNSLSLLSGEPPEAESMAVFN